MRHLLMKVCVRTTVDRYLINLGQLALPHRTAHRSSLIGSSQTAEICSGNIKVQNIRSL